MRKQSCKHCGCARFIAQANLIYLYRCPITVSSGWTVVDFKMRKLTDWRANLENTRGFQATGSAISPTRCNYILFNENVFCHLCFFHVVRLLSNCRRIDRASFPPFENTSVTNGCLLFFSLFFLSKSWKLGWVKIEFLFPLLLYYTRIDRFYESFGNDSFGIYRFELVDWKMEECVVLFKDWVKFLLNFANYD